MEDPKKGLPAYDEPLDSELIDPDPDFRETLRLLNEAGAHTVSSCQGHAPGTQYPDVQEWMNPYITCFAGDENAFTHTEGLLKTAGGMWVEVKAHPKEGKLRASFPQGWEWSKSVAWLRTKIEKPVT